MKALLIITISLFSFQALAKAKPGDYLIKLTPEMKSSMMMQLQSAAGTNNVTDLKINNWVRVQIPEQNLNSFDLASIKRHPGVLYIQPNYKVKLMENPSLARLTSEQILKAKKQTQPKASIDNPPIPKLGKIGSGKDPLFDKQWGMNDIGVKDGWKSVTTNQEVVVAVIDTGVDYTHEDLVNNLWRNPGEMGQDSQGRDKSTNGIDDDNNGFVDDLIGWDFADKDNKPYDKTGSVFMGGNPGHGTHCAGNVGARGNNGKGIAGVAPNVKLMVLRFITDKGQGTTADAILSIKYAVDNGAHLSSNSWGSEGEDPNDTEGNQALRDMVQYSQDHGRLFIAAAGNGHQGRGYDNDSDANPSYPASYDHDIIISVAALDSADRRGSFSNWGVKTVDIGAPGVQVFSTTVGSKYSDSVIPGMATWDGTSMAAPHVAGAAALYLTKHPNADWRTVKQAILSSAAKIPSMGNKVVSGGKLDVKALMAQ